MGIIGKDEWHRLLNCSQTRWLNFKTLHQYTVCVISGLRGVYIIFGHFFVTALLYTKNLEFEKSSTFFIFKVFYFLKHFSIIYVLLYITL